MPEGHLDAPEPSNAQLRAASGVVVGTEVKATPGADGSYQRDFIKIYQDAGVVGLSFLTLIVLCVMLGMFCIRLLKLFQEVSSSQSAAETSRTQAVEKLSTSVLLLRQEVNSTVAELRSENQGVLSRLDRIGDSLASMRNS